MTFLAEYQHFEVDWAYGAAVEEMTRVWKENKDGPEEISITDSTPRVALSPWELMLVVILLVAVFTANIFKGIWATATRLCQRNNKII
mmetsp:Transcript_16148/g.39785  ORF Transcript_16148/g.39785 Transcript_16148/m.39785 type:complete len:88 (+) Transcript_16148:136-399(+)